MQNAADQQRIKAIRKMLFELAAGNLLCRLDTTADRDKLSELEGLLNTFADKMQQVLGASQIEKYGYLIPSTATATKQSEIELVQKVHAYIVNHLEDPLPSTRQLAKLFGTNDYYLKYCVRTLCQTSIYQLYNDERLKKAHLLIQQTTIPFNEIAFLCGFSDYINFYKAFRKKYHYAPSDVKRAIDA